MSLVDTNILVHAHNERSARQAAAQDCIRAAMEEEGGVQLAQQNLLEFVSVVTSAKRIERPVSTGQAIRIIAAYMDSDRVTVILPSEMTWGILVDLLRNKETHGASIFDDYLAATILSNGVHRIYTENIKDFASISNIQAINPFKE